MKKLAIAFLIVGGLLFLVGLYFNLMQWPDLFVGIVSGPALMIIGILFFVFNRLKK